MAFHPKFISNCDTQLYETSQLLTTGESVCRYSIKMDTEKVIQLPSREIVEYNNRISVLKETRGGSRAGKGSFNLFILFEFQRKLKLMMII